MSDLVQRALAAKRESKYIEFKASFDPSSPGEWCEIIRDIVAIANSGGGIIVFGLDSLGSPSGVDLTALAQVDPADIGNKISKYTGPVHLELEIREVKKQGKRLQAFLVQTAAIPIVFQRPGTYDIGSGKQKTAFSVGTVYFRHGAKSEPGNSDDIRSVIERHLDLIRKSWIKGVRKVVQAPEGSQIIAVRPSAGSGATSPSPTLRGVKDPKATPVLLTRDREKSSGVFVHEEVSEGIFDEINNVIDANRALARGQRHFFLGSPVYYRIYAERQHVKQSDEDTAVLLHSAVCDLYAPALFWAVALPSEVVAGAFAELYLHPRSPEIHSLIRMSALLGDEFYEWLFERWHRKWKGHAQPPNFYWGFKQLRSKMADTDPRLLAAHANKSTLFVVSGEETVGVSKLLDCPQLASSLVSAACMRVFQGDKDLRSTARNLDYFAYGPQLRELGPRIGKAITKMIGDREAGDLGETTADVA
jgi:Putative DNA-binding domain